MTRVQLLELTTDLLGGREMGTSKFTRLLNIVKNKREATRPWVYLEAEDSSNTASTSDTFLTAKTLPTRFLRTVTDDKMVLRSGDNVLEYKQLPFKSRQVEKDTNNRFYIDLKNNQFFLTGIVDQSYTIYFYYIQGSEDFDDDADEWVFPARFHELLAYDVAVLEKGGIDYDDINARMAQFNGITAKELEQEMIKWDNELRLAEQEGVENNVII